MFLLVLLLSGANIPGAVHSDSLGENNSSFWDKVGFGFGYYGGLCWTGDDLARANPYPLEISAQFYWLNSVEGSLTYPVSETWVIEVGLGYGWTKIDKHRSLSYDITNIPFSVGLTHNKHIMKFSYIDANITKITGSDHFHYYQGEGKGYEISYRYQINKIFGFNIKVGEVFYTIIQEDNEYKINQSLNGIGLSLGYKFNLPGGEK